MKIKGKAVDNKGLAALVLTLAQHGGGSFNVTGKGAKRMVRFTYYDAFYKRLKTVGCKLHYAAKTDTYTLEAWCVVAGETYSH